VSRKEADEAHHSRRALSLRWPPSDTNEMPFSWRFPDGTLFGSPRGHGGEILASGMANLQKSGAPPPGLYDVPCVTRTARRSMPFSPAPAGRQHSRGRWFCTFPHGCRIGRALATFMNDAVATATGGVAVSHRNGLCFALFTEST
jgi:hypothetical protein